MQNNIIRDVLKEAVIESSSDFIVSVYQIAAKIDNELMLQIDPVYRWEYANWHDDWEPNVSFITRKLYNLDKRDYAEVGQSYDDILKFFLENPEVSKIYKLDEEDHIGWKIYKELAEKRDYCKKMFITTK